LKQAHGSIVLANLCRVREQAEQQARADMQKRNEEIKAAQAQESETAD
jgi:hypothetical protein